jgi:MoaA/NifB/PqqE/SkfB family radical SAM enzyme
MNPSWQLPNPREHLYVTVSTVCALRCRFCGYSASSVAGRLMSEDLFRTVVDDACRLGFDAFGLTPVVGEAFADPGFLEKLALLEEHPGVHSFSFVTNLLMASESALARVAQLGKLRSLSISVYGYDGGTFGRLTGGTAAQWAAFLRALSAFADLAPTSRSHVEILFRTEGPFVLTRCEPPLRAVVERLCAMGVEVKPRHRYSNWGGLVTPEDVADLEITMREPLPERRGPCALPFYKNAVLPDGRVTACACRDANAALLIGDLRAEPLRDVYSRRNRRYLKLLDGQARGEYCGPCRSCTMFRSVERPHDTYRHHRKPFVSPGEFLASLSA